ncbi:MAG: SDR family oxidoreductase [Candidatus Nitrotoga sp.]|nr:SDR family oxidoreductase [Candidatus Nitrotoga sp.]MDW7604017.1 SDR family oxidoreductase [Candidatus Nitrotoga sp.]MDW7612613.1 SDR family oxidoreductase [Candidatus Nitrotoga sp.]MDW7625777.1 SDR family oxidoreductase [Candidatus Nitrotoga sp.]
MTTQRVVISGASSGLGLALAHHYIKQGAKLGVLARRADLLQKLFGHLPQQVHRYSLDIRDSSAMQAAAQDFITHVGAPHIVIANAGISIGTLTEYADDIDVFQQIMDTNVLGTVKTFQPFLIPMREARYGSLVGIASVAGCRGLPGAGAYCASKAALISYMESLRVELHGSGVRAITICPGYIRTPMTALNPYTMPFILPAEEAAHRVAWAIHSGRSFTVVPWQMGLVWRMLKLLPDRLYDALFSRAGRKPRKQST